MTLHLSRIATGGGTFFPVIFIAVLCAAADEDGVNGEGKVFADSSSEKDEGEWTKDVIEDTLALMSALEKISELSQEELDQLRACFSSNEDLTSCGRSESPRSKRWTFSSTWTSLVKTVKNTVFVQIEQRIKSYRGNHSCYEGIGCFNPENGTGLEIGGPEDPEKIGTRFVFFPNHGSAGIEVNHTTWGRYYETYKVDLAKPLFGITHGFTRDRDMTWMEDLKDALLNRIDCNVLIVEWIDGAMFPNYAAAAANTPLPGILLSLLLMEMMQSSDYALMPQDMHLIGFSLGAHQAGFCARHLESNTGHKLGRITGLDPAGPLFENSNVSLSKTDAIFVDIIHTNGGKLSESKLGLNESIGHVDFYPNGGSDQPKCTDPLNLVCSHKRAQALFTESVMSANCSFTSHYCKEGWEGYRDCKNLTNSSYIGEMGIDSIKKLGRGDQYLETNDQAPYCKGIEGHVGNL
ncbi:phospholipase A1-like isoform X1 [Amblyomma americanum]